MMTFEMQKIKTFRDFFKGKKYAQCAVIVDKIKGYTN